MIPTYELTGDEYEISGRGTVYIARLTCKCRRDDLQSLIGTEVKGETIIGIESSGICSQVFNPIGLLVKKGEKTMAHIDKITM